MPFTIRMRYITISNRQRMLNTGQAGSSRVVTFPANCALGAGHVANYLWRHARFPQGADVSAHTLKYIADPRPSITSPLILLLRYEADDAGRNFKTGSAAPHP